MSSAQGDRFTSEVRADCSACRASSPAASAPLLVRNLASRGPESRRAARLDLAEAAASSGHLVSLEAATLGLPCRRATRERAGVNYVGWVRLRWVAGAIPRGGRSPSARRSPLAAAASEQRFPYPQPARPAAAPRKRHPA